MTVLNRGFISPGFCSGMSLPLYTIIYTNAKKPHLYRTHDHCGDTIEKSQAPDDGYINVRNMLSIEDVK